MSGFLISVHGCLEKGRDAYLCPYAVIATGDARCHPIAYSGARLPMVQPDSIRWRPIAYGVCRGMPG
jgi:hypothetical protein